MRTEIIVQDQPLEVFLQGSYLETDKCAIAIVGTREPTPAGIKTAKMFSSSLTREGITIVSGLARGIDTAAHQAALDAGGRTIAVLAHGTDIIYPPENWKLANEIMKHGCLMTKFKPGTPPFKKNFLARNQLIAGLSLAVLVVEGQRKSGTLSTAAHAAAMGIEVFVIPGSPATDWLKKQGANVANSPQDILDYIDNLGVLPITPS